jgi:hypothetical protein
MPEHNERSEAQSNDRIPGGQRLFDNIFLWLILSFLISGVIYNLWGLIEVLGAPKFPH